MTTTEAAAERPQHMMIEYDKLHQWLREQSMASFNRMMLETDPTPITEEFARSVGYRRSECYYVDHRQAIGITLSDGKCYLRINGDDEIFDPTIGQFWTATRLFNVDVKEKA